VSRWRLLLVACVCVAAGCRKAPTAAGGDESGRVEEKAKEPVEDVVAEVRGRPAPKPKEERAAAEDVTASPAGEEKTAQPVVTGDTARIAWSLTPAELDVMRDTEVVMEVTWPDVPAEAYRCVFDPGDRTGEIAGCRVKHRFEGGLADRTVTVSVQLDGREVFRESRPLNLERLPVADIPSGAGPVPPRPGAGAGQRIAFAGLFAEPDDAGVSLLDGAFDSAEVELAFLFVNYAADADRLQALLERLNASASRAVLPVYCRAGSLPSAPMVQSPRVLLHGEGNKAPWQYAFLSAGNLYVLLDPRQTSFDLEQEKWMLGALSGGAHAPHRVVVSCSPLEKYTAREVTELEPRFRYYEKLLRGDITLLVSSVYPVFYHGRYGDLDTLSSGCAVGQPGALLSSVRAQPRVISVVDLVPREGAAVYAASPDGANAQADLTGVPFKVGNYVLKL